MDLSKCTPEQLKAIRTTDKTLLVCAAAGAGKTSTLTNRIISSILREENPEDISKMLIVTFTNLATKELRDKITGAIKKELLLAHGGKGEGTPLPDEEERKRLLRIERLEKQLRLLPSAKISTIDAFCGEIFRGSAERFGVSPTYRIADTVEAKLLCRTTISSIINAIYNGELCEVATPLEFEALAMSLTTAKSDGSLEDSIELLYEKTKSLEVGVKIFESFADDFEKYATDTFPLSENPYCTYAISRMHEVALHYKLTLTELLSTLNLGTDQEQKYIDVINSDLDALNLLLCTTDYVRMQELFPTKFASTRISGEKLPSVVDVIEIRDKMKDALKKVRDKFFTYSEKEFKDHLSALASLTRTLYKLLDKLDRVYFEEKRIRSMLEHSDVERLAYMSLYNPDGSLSDTAMALKESFSSVYIDEYQDVNDLQNKIFEAISRPDNRFMVGDIKQSIYGFRSANPEIFKNLKTSFPDFDKATPTDSCATIFMSDNFRSDKCVIDFTNSIFDVMFELAGDSIGYVPSDRLNYSKKQSFGEPCYIEPQTVVFDTTMSRPDEYDEGEEESTAQDLPPIFVAKKIKQLIDEGTLVTDRDESGNEVRVKAQPRHFAIILRSDRGRAKAYRDALADVGVSAEMPDDKDFLFNSEIQLVLCLLNAINNPKRDIYLAGLMLSPLFDFTPDELYLIRSAGKNLTLWDAVLLYKEENAHFTKLASFVDTLNKYRELAEGVKVDAFLLRLYNETGLLALASRNGCKENLMLLYNYAKSFEASSFEGLYSFISYVNTIIETDAKFSPQKEGGENNAVRIVTVHKSKGLEYPIVFLGDAGKKLSSGGRATKFAYAEGLGFAVKERTPGGLALIDSPVYTAIRDYNADRELEEELRVYYVALTRARERLYITGVVGNKDTDIEKFLNNARLKKICRTKYTLRQMSSFVDIILTSMDKPKITVGMEEEEEKADTPLVLTLPDGDRECEKVIDENITKLLDERFSFVRGDAHLSLLPEKMSISRLSPNVLDGLDDEGSVAVEGTTAPLDESREKTVYGELDEEDTEYSTDTNTELGADTEAENGADKDVSLTRVGANERKRASVLPSFVQGSKADESRRCGIVTHNFLQFFEFNGLDTLGPTGELQRLIDKEFISEENRARVRITEIELFKSSELYKQMKSATRLWREFRFNVMLPAEEFTDKENVKALLCGREILLQGVVDCIIEDSEGNLHLIDYKTDRLTKEQLADKTLAQKELKRRHGNQLTYYAMAIEKIFGKLPKTKRVYSLHLGDTVEV